jgi:hypothetical protein
VTEIVDLVPTYGEVESSVDVGLGIEILFMQDGEVRVAHDCDRHIRLPNSKMLLRCAPRLMIGQGHTVVTREPLTIVASILCSDCGLHGFVTNGVWVPA